MMNIKNGNILAHEGNEPITTYMNQENYKKISELNFELPVGGWECMANISYIVACLQRYFPNTNFELTRSEFIGFMSSFGNEVLVSCMLDERDLKMREILHQGFDFRGIKIRVR